MGYQWKGTHTGPDMFDATAPQPKQVAAPLPKPELQPCGTRAAYKRHRRKAEQPCQPCKTAEALYQAARRPRRRLKPCGTMAAYKRHHRKKEQTCGPCRKAYSEYRAAHPRPARLRPKQMPKPKPELKSCGTWAAYNRHLRRGEPACEPCRQASADRAAEMRGGRKAPRDAKCGTRSGYHRHKKEGEIPCGDCREANTTYKRLYWERIVAQDQAA